jgi:hypothetical protein
VGIEFTSPEAKNGHPYSGQYWCGFQPISGPKISKTATVKTGQRKGVD